MGSLASRAAGVRIVVNADGLAVMGVTDVVARLRLVRSAWRQLQLQTLQLRPKVALLAGFTEFHARLGRLAARAGRSGAVVWSTSSLGVATVAIAKTA